MQMLANVRKWQNVTSEYVLERVLSASVSVQKKNLANFFHLRPMIYALNLSTYPSISCKKHNMIWLEIFLHYVSPHEMLRNVSSSLKILAENFEKYLELRCSRGVWGIFWGTYKIPPLFKKKKILMVNNYTHEFKLDLEKKWKF